jgi:hypothetical protein
VDGDDVGDGKCERVRDNGLSERLRDWLEWKERLMNDGQLLGKLGEAYTRAMQASRTHSAASRSPPRASVATHSNNSSWTCCRIGSFGTSKMSSRRSRMNRTWRVGTTTGSSESAWSL